MSVLINISKTAFTYDQQAIPSSPVRGQSWRERDSNNDIVEEWFWNGTYWLSSNINQSFNHQTVGAVANGSILILPIKNSSIFFLNFWAGFSTLGNTNNTTNYWTFTFDVVNNGGISNNITSINTQNDTWVGGNNYIKEVQNSNTTIINKDIFKYMLISVAETGTSSGIHRYHAGIQYRIIR